MRIKTQFFVAALALAMITIPAAPSHSQSSSAAAKSSSAPSALTQTSASAPTFYRDVAPILRQHCQSCHRLGEIAPMPLVTYNDARLRAGAIASSTSERRMPPWFADPRFGHFSNDPTLTPQEIATLVAWAAGGAPAGAPVDTPPPPAWTSGWNIPPPDRIITMPKPVALPAHGDVDYTYEIVPTNFAQDAWVQMSEVRPSSRENVHHAVVYIRPPDSKWLRGAPVGVPFTAADLTDAESRHGAHWTDADILLVYAPGSSPDRWPEGMAKLVPARSDLIFQMHYTTHGHATSDQTSVGIVFVKDFARQTPRQRVLTLQLTNDHFVIPPGADDFRVEARGSLPNDATLLSFLPHMHLRGKTFEYNILRPGKKPETLLRVNWDFYWQMSYRLAQPLELQAGTELQAVACYDNSRDNPHNPDPDAAVHWGDQTYDEMMVGFFDIAVPAGTDKWKFFVRPDGNPQEKK
jgi:hypothetical protein